MSDALQVGADDGQVMQRNGKRAGRMNDLIKREDAIGAFEEELNGVNIQEAIKVVDAYLRIRECDAVWDAIRAIRDCMECAKDTIAEFVPSADRPQGEWIDDGLDAIGVMGVEYRWHKCSQCGFRISKSPSAYYPNFCEACGARMKGADDE